jgi:V/A-type H+/Na+-transporting ATPase subunit D
MADIKLTKMGYRDEQVKLKQLESYLPTLHLKKFMLQVEINNALMEIAQCKKKKEEAKNEVEIFATLLDERYERSPLFFCQILHVEKHYENVAGVELSVFEKVTFREIPFFLFDTPIWFDSAIRKLRHLITLREMLSVFEEKRRALEKELRDVSIRVNLFEKILVPRIKKNIKKIKVFLGDQELAAISRAKMAKKKIEGALR